MYVSGVGDRGLRVMRKGRSLFSPQNTREAEIPELAGRVCGPHELLDLHAMSPAAQVNRGTGKEQ